MDGFERAKVEMAMDQIVAASPMIIKLQVEASKLMFTYFNSLCRAGFNPAQALQIVTAHGMIPRFPNVGNDEQT